MKPFLHAAFVLLVFSASVSEFALASEAGDVKTVQSCLAHWGKAPFSKEHPVFRTISSKVKVLGIGGGGGIDDEVATPQPQLVLIKPSVSVLSKKIMTLLNPNGWYCIKGQVTVLGSTEIQLHCKASLASSADGATILGGDDDNGQKAGVTVLGATHVKRVGCGG